MVKWQRFDIFKNSFLSYFVSSEISFQFFQLNVFLIPENSREGLFTF